MERQKGRSSKATHNRHQRRKLEEKQITVPQTAEQYFAMSKRSQDEWNTVVQVISKMGSGRVSLQEASRELGVDPRKVVRLGRTALRKRANGRYAAKTTNRLLRVLVLPTNDGLREITVRDSKQASQIGKYWAAVQKYLQTGDISALKKIRRKWITDADGKRTLLLKDTGELDRLGSAGVLCFESLYAKAA